MIESIVGVAGNVLDKFVADKDLKAKLDHELKTAFHSANLAQIEINKQEAAHKSMFVAGWRPFVGWDLWCCTSVSFCNFTNIRFCFSFSRCSNIYAYL